MSPVTEASGLPVKRTNSDPRADDPRWQKARSKAARMAVAHFECHDVSAQTIESFIWRETLRLLGEPVTKLHFGWGRTLDHRVKPEIPPELQAQLTAREACQWRTRAQI